MVHRSIGTQTAILAAKQGASTLLLSDLSDSALEKLKKSLALHEASFPDCRLLYQICDVSDESQVVQLFAQLDTYGGPDATINNAGVFPTALDGDAIGVTAAAWELTHRINVLGTWLGSKHAVLSMRRHNKTRGSVVNVSSVAGLIGSATSQLAYAASKGAVISLTRELGIVHAKEGYRFNTVCPGLLNNPMLNEFLDSEDTEDATKIQHDSKEAVADDDGDAVNTVAEEKQSSDTRLNKRQRREIHLPQGRFGETIEASSAILFLASDASAFINSTELVVDGGMTKVCTALGVTNHTPIFSCFLPSMARYLPRSHCK